MTQYDLERRYAAWWAAGADPSRCGTVADWLLELPGDRLVLHPVTHRWLSFDPAHEAWLSTGIVPGEAILVRLGTVLGAKRALREDETRLPLEERIERIAARVVVAVDGELAGPMEVEAAQALRGERPASTLHVWSTRQPNWCELPAIPA